MLFVCNLISKYVFMSVFCVSIIFEPFAFAHLCAMKFKIKPSFVFTHKVLFIGTTSHYSLCDSNKIVYEKVSNEHQFVPWKSGKSFHSQLCEKKKKRVVCQPDETHEPREWPLQFKFILLVIFIEKP